MGTLTTILLFTIICCLSVLLIKERALIRELEDQNQDLSGLRDTNLFGKGKFSELGLMAAGISHEISNPLSIILGRVTQLQRIYRDPEKVKDVAAGLTQIRAQSERLAKIVSELRSYIYRDDEQVEARIPLRDILGEVQIFLGERLKNHGIELRPVNLDGIYLSGHRGQLTQAVLNLINNSFDAVDALPEKWIEISAVKNEGFVDLYFKDSGTGISGEIRTHMMEPFYSTKKNRGSGLGLPLVRSIAETHGGAFQYIEHAEHTTFLLELPRAA